MIACIFEHDKVGYDVNKNQNGMTNMSDKAKLIELIEKGMLIYGGLKNNSYNCIYALLNHKICNGYEMIINAALIVKDNKQINCDKNKFFT